LTQNCRSSTPAGVEGEEEAAGSAAFIRGLLRSGPFREDRRDAGSVNASNMAESTGNFL